MAACNLRQSPIDHLLVAFTSTMKAMPVLPTDFGKSFALSGFLAVAFLYNSIWTLGT